MASLLPNGEQTFLDDDGNPLSDGTVEFYVPGTTTPKDTWQDASRTIPNTNPVELDSAGRAIIYGEGVYRQIVKDSEGNTIWDQLTTGAMETSTLFGGDIVGTPTALVMTPTSPLGSLSNGVTVWGFATQNNGAAATLNVSGLGAKSILRNGVTLSGNEILEDTVAAFTYETATDSWHLETWEGAGLGRNDFAGVQNEAQSTDIVAAATIDLDSVTGNLIDVTGSTGITAITLQQGAERVVRFTGAPLITNGASLVLPGGENIQAAAGDFAIFRGYAAGIVRCVVYSKANGESLAGAVVRQANINNLATTITTTSSSFTSTGLTVALLNALKNTSSKVRIRVFAPAGASTAGARVSLTVYDGTSELHPVGTDGFGGLNASGDTPSGMIAFEFVSSPASTTPKTYTLRWKTSTGTAVLGRNGGTGAPANVLPVYMIVEELLS